MSLYYRNKLGVPIIKNFSLYINLINWMQNTNIRFDSRAKPQAFAMFFNFTNGFKWGVTAAIQRF
ncbi:hypothetical protein CsatB_019914 [Cannabis sativa]